MDRLDEILCVIPARGGSKGIYKKNERLVGGKPLVAHSIEHAIRSNIPRSNIVVSSDSSSVLTIARQYDVVSHIRPEKISGDTSSTELALIDALNSKMPEANHVLLLQPTSPIRFRETIPNCLMAYAKGKHDSLITVTKFYNFFWEEHSCRSGWDWKSVYSPCDRPMRQDLKRQDYRYFDNGNVYITQSDLLRNTQCRVGNNPCIYPISELESLQIDSPDDLRLVDAVLTGKVGAL